MRRVYTETCTSVIHHISVNSGLEDEADALLKEDESALNDPREKYCEQDGTASK